MEIRDLIVDDKERGIFRVHRSSMTSMELFHREKESVFSRGWVYLGHESEVECRGDYRRRTVAGRPLFFARGRDGEIRVFLNTCPHRGALICRRDEGNTEVLQCFYHAWTFNTAGELIGVPGEDAYGPGFHRGEMGLRQPPRVDSYRGFIFVSFNPNVEDLVSYLADAREYLDLVVDQTEGAMRVIPGSQKYDIKANWKLLVENSLDGYHIIPTHKTYLNFLASLEAERGGRPSRPPLRSLARSLGNGHCAVETGAGTGRPIARWHPLFGEEAKEPIATARQRLVDKYGEERAFKIADTARGVFIYPNLIINDVSAITIRYFEPVTPNNMEVTAWHLVPEGESDAMLATRLDSFLTFLGPGGFATPDDVEALESCQAGFGAAELEWSDLSRGMHNPSPRATDELQMRGFWRQWHADMQGLPYADVQDAQPLETETSLAVGG